MSDLFFNRLNLFRFLDNSEKPFNLLLKLKLNLSSDNEKKLL